MFTVVFLISLILPYSLSQPIEETKILENVIISNYTGHLNEHILDTYFDRVGTLQINNSNITELSKTTLKLLSQLENLTISDSTIQKSDDDIFLDCCPSLKNLKISNWVNLEDEDLQGIGTLPLESLSISNQNFSELGADIFRNTNLTYLSLDHNRIKKLSNEVFDDLYQLKVLSLSWNDLEELPRDTLSPLKRLKSLKLETDKFKKFSHTNLTYLPELTEIFLTKKELKEVNLWGIEEKAPKLRDLYLVGDDGVDTGKNRGPTIHL